MQDLIPIENAQPGVLFAPGGLDQLLSRIAGEARALVPDTSTKKGRDAIASNAHKVARSKTYLEEIGKGYAAEIKELPKRVDAERKRVRDILQALQDEVRAPLTEWERAEAALQAEADALVHIILAKDLDAMSSDDLRLQISGLETLVVPSHFTAPQQAVVRNALGHQALALQKALSAATHREAEAAEAARIQAEIAAQHAQNIERTRLETEQRIAAENAAKAREAERQAQAEKDARETDEAKKACHREALDALIDQTGMDHEEGKDIIRMIIQGLIPHVRFEY